MVFSKGLGESSHHHTKIQGLRFIQATTVNVFFENPWIINEGTWWRWKKEKQNVALKTYSFSMNKETKEEYNEAIASLTRKFHQFLNSKRGGIKNSKKIPEQLNEREWRKHCKKNCIIC